MCGRQRIDGMWRAADRSVGVGRLSRSDCLGSGLGWVRGGCLSRTTSPWLSAFLPLAFPPPSCSPLSPHLLISSSPHLLTSSSPHFLASSSSSPHLILPLAAQEAALSSTVVDDVALLAQLSLATQKGHSLISISRVLLSSISPVRLSSISPVL